jgi:hypothetical protein
LERQAACRPKIRLNAADHLRDVCLANEWKEQILGICDIGIGFYKSHYHDAESSDAKMKKLFCKDLKDAILVAKNFDD